MKKLEQKNFTDSTTKNEENSNRIGRFELPEIPSDITGNMEVDEKNPSDYKKAPVEQINVKQNLQKLL